MVDVMSPTRHAAEDFVAAIANQTFADFNVVLAPEVRFRALTPRKSIELSSSSDAVATITGWFGDATSVTLESSSVDHMSDRTGISYRMSLDKDGERKLVEQRGWCIVENGLITDISLVCSGSRPIPDDMS